MRKLTKYQEKLLTELVGKYEESRTYAGTNRVNQSFYRTPTQIFKDYDDDFADADLVKDFEEQMEDLQDQFLVRLEWKYGVITKIFAQPDSWDRMNALLHREDKNEQAKKQLAFFSRYLGTHEILDAFCQEQMQRLREGKRTTFELDDVERLLKLLKIILFNQNELLERELSITVFGDSKLFEKSYRSRVCKLLQKYGKYDSLLEGIDDHREIEQVLLGEYNIYANPAYIYMKGNAEIFVDNGSVIKLSADMPLALSTIALKHVINIQVESQNVMTIENLTSFNRLTDVSYFYIFLSGYHNSSKQKLLKQLYDQNPGHRWLHFGDLDPDGFYILEHLLSGTGIPFECYQMSVEDLIKFREYSKPLKKNDIVKAETLLSQGLYVDQMEYMLKNNCKLEQEIISWTLEQI